MNAHDESWEDLRLVLAIVRGKGLSGASRLLGVHHATVLRRLESFEKRAGVALFHRVRQGYEPTDVGEELARRAEMIEEDVLGAYRQLAGQDLRLSGTIRCATSDYIAQSLLPPALRLFRKRYPDIEIEVSMSPHFASLTRRDADVAIRAANDIPHPLVGDAVAQIGFGLYGSKAYLNGQAGDPDPEELDWIGVDDSLAHVSTNQWRVRDFPKSNPRTKFGSLLGIHAAVKNALGVGFLPHYLAATDPELARVRTEKGDWSLGLWLLTHPDLRHMYRVRAFFKCFAEATAERDLAG